MSSMGIPNNKHRNQIAVRLVTLIKLLEGQQWLPNLYWLALTLRVCTRTVRRDLAALKAAGWPLPPPREQEVA